MIDHFDGANSFLSNFFIERDGSSVEHKFQASKTRDRGEQIAILCARTPGVAKRMGRKVTLRGDWDNVRLTIMCTLVAAKFKDEELAAKLVATHPHELVEGNYWGDTFWGVCNGVGENHLGVILMEVRSSLM